MKCRLTFLMAAVAMMTMTVEVHAAIIDGVSGNINLASGASATSSDVLFSPAWSPNQLTDGIFNAAIHGTGPGGQAGGRNPLPGFGYTIDLGSTQSFDSIDIFPRQDNCCPDRLKDVHLAVHSDNAGSPGPEVWSADIFQGANADPATSPGSVHSFGQGDGTGTFSGRFISIITNQNPVEVYDLQLSEVEVLAAGFTPINHALGAPVVTSGPTFNNAAQGADKITDGNDQTLSHPAATENVGVGNPSNGFSYTIEMATPVDIDNINVKGRADGCACSDRLLDYRIEVFTSDPSVGSPVPVFTQDATGLVDVNARVDNYGGINQTGTFVRITNLSDISFSPQIAEVEVFGHAVPEPTTFVMLLVSMLSLGIYGYRRK